MTCVARLIARNSEAGRVYAQDLQARIPEFSTAKIEVRFAEFCEVPGLVEKGTARRLLMLDDNAGAFLPTLDLFCQHYECFLCPMETIEEALEAFHLVRPWACTLDLSIGKGGGLDNTDGYKVLSQIRAKNHWFQPIIVSRYPFAEQEKTAGPLAAFAYVHRPSTSKDPIEAAWELEEFRLKLFRFVKRAMDQFADHEYGSSGDAPDDLPESVPASHGDAPIALLTPEQEAVMRPKIVGESPALVEALSMAARFAATRLSILVTGERGTGKELVARAIHELSPRRGRNFVPVNCGALPEDVVESEFFGHVVGAFTGATAPRQGKFEYADGGTLFFDEVGNMTLSIQAKLLRVLEDRTITPVGGNEPIPVDVRVIAATNLDLEAAVAAGTFRGDLYSRLNVLRVRLPPLRERREDIPRLVRYLIRQANQEHGTNVRATRRLISCCYALDWPGNVRDLKNQVERMAVLNRIGDLDPSLLSREFIAPRPDAVDLDYFRRCCPAGKDPSISLALWKLIHDETQRFAFLRGWREYLHLTNLRGQTPAQAWPEARQKFERDGDPLTEVDLDPACENAYIAGLALMGCIIFQIKSAREMKEHLDKMFRRTHPAEAISGLWRWLSNKKEKGKGEDEPQRVQTRLNVVDFTSLLKRILDQLELEAEESP